MIARYKNQVLSALLLVAVLGAFAWILIVFHFYLPALSPLRSLDFWLRRTGAYDVFLMLWFAGVAYCMGRQFLRLIGVTPVAGAEDAAFSIASGTMLFSWIVLILALAHGLYRPVAYALLLVPSVIWGGELRTALKALCKALIGKIRSVSWNASAAGVAFLSAYVFMVLGVTLISALGPSYEYDDLVYHLAGPKNFVLAHRLVPLPDVPMALFPKNIEMLHTLGMLLHNDIVSKLLVFLSGCITMLGIYAFSARFISRTIGMVSVAILASSPLFIWEMRTAHNDIGLALFLLVGLYATVIWLRTREAPWFRLACLFLAFSMGIKYWALLAGGIIVSLVFLMLLWHFRAWRPAFGGAFKLGLYSSLGVLPWSVVSLFYTGNPFFPLLNNIFQSPFWTGIHTKMMLGEMFGCGIRISFSNWWDLFRLPWQMLNPQANFGGNIGPWYVILLPFLLFSPAISVELGFILAAAVLYYIGWAIYGPLARFLLPALPALAAAAAFATVRLIQRLHLFSKALGISGAIFLAVLAILASPFFEAEGSWSRYGNPPLYTLPLKYLSGEESKSEYLHFFYPEIRAVEYLNEIPGDKKVLYVQATPDGFYLKGKSVFHYSPYVPALSGADADQIHRVLQQNGVTHFIVGQPGDGSSLSSRESDFTRRYLRKLYQRNARIVYELLARPIDQTVVVFDFLDRLQDTSAAQIHPGTPGGAYKEVRALGDDSRYALVTAPPSEVEFFTAIPDHATLNFDAGREDPDYAGKGTLQVWIGAAGMERRLVYSRDLEGNIRDWIENQVDLSEYAGRQVSIILRTDDPSHSCKYFWADPVLMAWRGAGSLESKSAIRDPEEKPIVWIGKAFPARVEIGQEFEMSFSGKALTPELYFDVRVLAPNAPAEQTVFNWQHGTSLRHSVDGAIIPGKWVITGVRAHRNPSYHQGEFDSVKIALEITR